MAVQDLSDRAGAPKFDALIDTPSDKTGFEEVFAPMVNTAGTDLEYKKVKPALTSDVTIEVDFSGGGDFTSCQAAWDYIIQFEPDGYSVIINITNIASLTNLDDLRISQTGGDWSHITLQWPGTQVVPVGLTASSTALYQFTLCAAPYLNSTGAMDLDLSNKYRGFCLWSGSSGEILASNNPTERFLIRNATELGVTVNGNVAFNIIRFSRVRANNCEILGTNNNGYWVVDNASASCNNSIIQADRYGIIAQAGSTISGTGSVDFTVGGTFFPVSLEDVNIGGGATINLPDAIFTGTRPKTNLVDTINSPIPDGVLFTNSEPVLTQSSDSGSMDGDYTSGNWTVQKVGGMVVFRWGTGAHPSASSASTSTPIPAEFRPAQNINNVYLITGTTVRNGRMTGAGILTTSYRDWTGASTDLTQADGGSMAWPIT